MLHCQMQNDDYSLNLSSSYLFVSLIIIVSIAFLQKKYAYFK